MNKIIITESQYAQLSLLLKEELLTEALKNIQDLLSEFPNAKYLSIKTNKGVNKYIIYDHEDGKIIVNDNPQSPHFNYSGLLSKVKVGGDNVYIHYDINDDHKPIEYTEHIPQAKGFQLRDKTSSILYPIPKNPIHKKKDSIINPKKSNPDLKPSMEPIPTENPEPNPEEMEPEEPTSPEEPETDEVSGADVYNYIMNDPTIRKAFYHEPKLLGLIKAGDPVGIAPAEKLIRKYERSLSNFDEDNPFEFGTKWSVTAFKEDISMADSDFKLLTDVYYTCLVEGGSPNSVFTTMTHDEDEDNPKFVIRVYNKVPNEKDVYEAKVRLHTKDGYKHPYSEMGQVKIIKPIE